MIKKITIMAVLIFSMFGTVDAKANNEFDFADENFEKMVRISKNLDDDVPITYEILNSFTYFSTEEGIYENGQYNSYYLTDFTDLLLLRNLQGITYVANIQDPVVPNNMDVLKNLPLEYIVFDIMNVNEEVHVDEFGNLIEEKLQGVKTAYRQFLENIKVTTVRDVSFDYSINMRDFTWLDGFDMGDNLKYISEYRREAPKTDKIDYEYSHNVGDEKVYKFHLDVPLISPYLDENNTVRVDKHHEYQYLEYDVNSMIFDNEDIFLFDKDGQPIKGEGFFPNEYLRNVSYIEFYLSENNFPEYGYLMDIMVDSNSQNIFLSQWIEYVVGSDLSTRHTVFFETFGGSEIAPLENVLKNSYLEQPTYPTKENNTFVAWYKDSECTELWDFDTDSVKGDMTLYAKWEADTHTVSFDSQGGSYVASIENVKHNSIIEKPSNPTKENNTFVAWYKDSECTELWDFDNDSVKGDMTLYAKWEADTHTVSFDSQGGSYVASIENVKHNSIIEKPTNPTKENNTFVAWYKDSECTELWDFDNDNVKDDMTLYAKWEEDTHTVLFDSQGGSYVTSIENVKHNSIIDKPADPHKIGYTFMGWKIENDFWDFETDTVTKDMTLTAEWREDVRVPEAKDPEKNTPEINNSQKEDKTVKTGVETFTYGFILLLIAALLVLFVQVKRDYKKIK